MPLGIFTPRVSVSRMCTLSVMLLAASVRRISAVISSSDGIWVNASACADRRSLARCSPSRKIRPLYRRRLSHTASPPCTTESNGLTPASSRWLSLPPTLTIRSRFRSSNVCSTVALLAGRGWLRWRSARLGQPGQAVHEDIDQQLEPLVAVCVRELVRQADQVWKAVRRQYGEVAPGRGGRIG